METIIDKLKKLAALAQRGEYGEADNAAFVKLLLSASFRNPWLKELIKTTAATFDYVHVDGVKFMGDPKGGDA